MMKSIDSLEYGGATGGRPFSVRYGGQIIALPDPREKHYQWVLAALVVQHVPGWVEHIPAKIEHHWPKLVFERWATAWDLPSFNDAQRLAYLVDKYRADIAHDLALLGYDLGDLWRARRWVLILDILDRLPAHSWYSAAVAGDEEHAQKMLESMRGRAEGENKASTTPSLVGWSPEVAKMAELLDAIRQVSYTVAAVKMGKKAGDPPKASPRPVSALEKAMRALDQDQKRAKHNALVARVLPNRE